MPATGARSVEREATGGVPKDERRGQAWAHTARSEGEGAGTAPRPAAVGGGQSTGSRQHDAGHRAGKGQEHGKDTGAGGSTRGRTQGCEQGAKAGGHRAHGGEPSAVGEWGRSQGHGHASGKDKGTGGAGKDAGDRGRVPRRGQDDKGSGAGKGPKGKGGKGDVGPWGQAGRGTGAAGGGQGGGRGTGSGRPPQPGVQPVRCIPPGIQQMPAQHTHHHHHQHAQLYNIDPNAGDLIPTQPSRPQHQLAAPAAPEPRAEAARMAAAPATGGQGAAPVPQARGPQE